MVSDVPGRSSGTWLLRVSVVRYNREWRTATSTPQENPLTRQPGVRQAIQPSLELKDSHVGPHWREA